jgi:flagellar biosynthesis/type III secretory pathway chaperone
MWEDIARLLEEEIGYYRVMVRAMDTQEAAMRQNDVARLNECVKVHEQLMTRISLADNKIREYKDKIKKEHNIHADLYLRRLARDFADEKNRLLIIKRGDELRALAAKLKEKMERCSKMLAKHIQFADYNVNVLTGAQAGETYASRGEQSGAFRKRKMFDESI